jgi:hypothetical protein
MIFMVTSLDSHRFRSGWSPRRVAESTAPSRIMSIEMGVEVSRGPRGSVLPVRLEPTEERQVLDIEAFAPPFEFHY